MVVVAAYRLIATNGIDIQTMSTVTTKKVENWPPVQLYSAIEWKPILSSTQLTTPNREAKSHW